MRSPVVRWEACKARVVGIDLGTTNSLVAHVEDGGPKVLGEDPIVPSVVWYAPSGGTLVGRRAQDMAVEEPARTLASVKRLIGRGMKDVEAVRGMLPYELVGDDRAVRMLAPALNGLVVGGTVTPNWMPDGRFWYVRTTLSGTENVVIDPVKRTREVVAAPPTTPGAAGGPGAS